MAIYHFSAKVIGRGSGRSAVAAAAYRCAGRLHDERLGRTHDFSNKAGVVHSEVMLPEGAPAALADRELLWNRVEAAEARKDAQLAREIEIAIPRELSEADGIALVRDFVRRSFVDQGMIADVNIHWDIARDGEPQPHAHVMLTMRALAEDAADWTPGEGLPFGAKVRAWNATAELQQWRAAWADHCNRWLAERGIDARVDHRSYGAQEIALEPQDKIGAAAMRRLERGHPSDRADIHIAIACANGKQILAEPGLAFDAITRTQATFTHRDMAKFAHRHSATPEQYGAVLAAMRASDQLVALGSDGRGEARFTSRGMIDCERRLAASAAALDMRGHDVSSFHVDRALARSAASGVALSGEQQDALAHVTRSRDLAIVIGYAGSGKSAMLGAAREAWEAEGYRVRGAALSGIAAENLAHGSGIDARTIASFEHQWARGREALEAKDVFVIDEAGMVGTRQMERVLAHARDAGAKVVLVGDAQQLQAIEAGAAFRLLAERHGAADITEVRRQRAAWQQAATRDLANGRTADALAVYRAGGMVQEAASRDAARTRLIAGWHAAALANPAERQIILTHTRDEVRTLNDLARAALVERGQLGTGVAVETAAGARFIAPGERIIFLRNEQSLGVKNGSLATVEQISSQHVAARLEDGRRVAFDLKSYADIDHGYASTIHKAQGLTVDRAHVLATPGLDSHASYVALSRHRDTVALHYGRDDFESAGKLARVLGRERPKDMAIDYDHNDGRTGPPPRGRAAAQTGQGAAQDRGAAQPVAAHESERAKGLRAMIAARVAQPRPTPEQMRENLAKAADNVAGGGKGADRGAER